MDRTRGGPYRHRLALQPGERSGAADPAVGLPGAVRTGGRADPGALFDGLDGNPPDGLLARDCSLTPYGQHGGRRRSSADGAADPADGFARGRPGDERYGPTRPRAAARRAAQPADRHGTHGRRNAGGSSPDRPADHLARPSVADRRRPGPLSARSPASDGLGTHPGSVAQRSLPARNAARHGPAATPGTAPADRNRCYGADRPPELRAEFAPARRTAPYGGGAHPYRRTFRCPPRTLRSGDPRRQLPDGELPSGRLARTSGTCARRPGQGLRSIRSGDVEPAAAGGLTSRIPQPRLRRRRDYGRTGRPAAAGTHRGSRLGAAPVARTRGAADPRAATGPAHGTCRMVRSGGTGPCQRADRRTLRPGSRSFGHTERQLRRPCGAGQHPGAQRRADGDDPPDVVRICNRLCPNPGSSPVGRPRA